MVKTYNCSCNKNMYLWWCCNVYKKRLQSFIWRYFYCAFLGSSLGMDSNVQCHCHCSSFFSGEKMVSFFSSENKNLFKNFNNVNLCWLPFMEEPVQSNLEKYRWLSLQLQCNAGMQMYCVRVSWKPVNTLRYNVQCQCSYFLKKK